MDEVVSSCNAIAAIKDAARTESWREWNGMDLGQINKADGFENADGEALIAIRHC